MNFHLGDLTRKLGDRDPNVQGRCMGTPKAHITAKERSRYLQALRRKSRLKKYLWRPLAAKPKVWGPRSRMSVGVAKAYNVLKFRRSQSPRSAARRLRRNLEMPYYENARFPIRAQQAKTLTTESEENSSTVTFVATSQEKNTHLLPPNKQHLDYRRAAVNVLLTKM